MATQQSQPDIVDVEAVKKAAGPSEAAQRLARKLLGESAAQKIEAARQRVRDEFQDRVAQAQERLQTWERKAADLATTVQATAHAAADKVREEKSEAAQRIETLVGGIAGMVAEKGSFDAWLKLPEEAREDVLTAAGVATQKQVAALQEEVAALRAEITAQFVAQTEVLTSLLGQGDEPAPKAPRAKPATAKKGRAAQA